MRSGLNVGGAVKIAFVTDIIGGTLAPLIDGAIGNAQRRQDDERQRRRAAAAELLDWMVPMVEQLHHLRDRRDTAFWVERIPIAYRSLDAMKIRLPRQWRHLKRSTRACLGEALGNGLVFLDTGDDVLSDSIDYSARWSSYAADYLALCLSRIREWEHEWSERSAQRIAIPDFDDWLRITERHPRY